MVTFECEKIIRVLRADKKRNARIGRDSGILAADYECGTNGRNSKQKISTDWRNIFGVGIVD